jgi:4-hydroxybenzoate polyprenyltransferase
MKDHHFMGFFDRMTLSLPSFLLTFFSLIIVRLMIESWITRFAPQTAYFYFYEFLHTATFFLLLFIICILLTRTIAHISFEKSAQIFLFGFILIIFPPIIDWIISTYYYSGASFMSYYLFDNIQGLMHSFVTFFGDRPHDGITYGTRIMIVCALIFMTFITFMRTRRIKNTILMFFCAYTLFFLLSALPSLVTFVFADQHFGANRSDVASFIASPTKILGNQISGPINAINVKMTLVYIVLNTFVILSLIGKRFTIITVALIKNLRPIQTLYHIGLFFVGMGVAIIFNDAIVTLSFFSILALLILFLSIIFAWYATVIFNDIIDQKIDTISNPHRPLIKKIITVRQYRFVGMSLTVLSVVLTAAISAHAALLLVGYHTISYIYNTPPLRLKQYPFIATLLASIASFFIVAMGYIIISPIHSLERFPPQIALLLIIAYTISLPIKDLKDISGDKNDSVLTIPVLFGESTGRMIIAIGIFSSFMLSVFSLHNMKLFFPALFFGSLCFWVLTGRRDLSFIFTPTKVMGIVFLIVFFYSVILTYSLIA